MAGGSAFTAYPREDRAEERAGLYPEIVVTGRTGKPYFEIKYYDPERRRWFIGYSSFDLRLTFENLERYFGVTVAKPSDYGEKLPDCPIAPGDDLYWVLEDDMVEGGWYVSEPCKVADVGTKGFYTNGVTGLADICSTPDFIPWDELGSTVFRTREEAEAALVKRKEAKA